MSVVVIVPPQPVVTLTQAKAQCRASGFVDDDTLISDLVDTATAWIDGPNGWLGRAIGVQTLELRLDGFFAHDWRFGPEWGFGMDWNGWGEGEWDSWSHPRRFGRIKLPYPPFISVTSITYEDLTGADQVLSAAGWNATDEGLTPAFGDVWPLGRIAADAVRIQYQAGYTPPSGAAQPPPNPVPPPIRQAILLLVSHWYNHPDAVVGVEARDSSTEMPLGVTELLGPYRVWDR